jgi:hypothetical protein
MRFEIKAAIGGLVLSYAFITSHGRVEDFQRSARSVRSRVKVPLLSDLLFRILH